MTKEDQSVKFIERHMKNSFAHIMDRQLIQEMYWLDYSGHARAVAVMYDPDLPEDKDCNLICLFPPFNTNK